ncbi:hypothetical protein B0H13DRAFT_1875371 [Mycena leptocephala]|nr:hypothetical protein B0H13DRAFT_1875371 [Mycena leptocephala]
MAIANMMLGTHPNFSYTQTSNHFSIEDRQQNLTEEFEALENLRQAQYVQTRTQARRAAEAGGLVEEPEQPICRVLQRNHSCGTRTCSRCPNRAAAAPTQVRALIQLMLNPKDAISEFQHLPHRLNATNQRIAAHYRSMEALCLSLDLSLPSAVFRADAQLDPALLNKSRAPRPLRGAYPRPHDGPGVHGSAPSPSRMNPGARLSPSATSSARYATGCANPRPSLARTPTFADTTRSASAHSTCITHTSMPLRGPRPGALRRQRERTVSTACAGR